MEEEDNIESRSCNCCERLEIILVVLNQMCIGFVTIYMSWLCLHSGLNAMKVHAWLMTIGFSFFMAEGLMCHYSANSLTSGCKRSTKSRTHWILEVIGGICGTAGILIVCIEKGFALYSLHGELGVVALIFFAFTMLGGLTALFPSILQGLIKRMTIATVHNMFGILTFTFALLSQVGGYERGFFRDLTEYDFKIMIKCITLLLLLLTIIGPIKSLIRKLTIMIKY